MNCDFIIDFLAFILAIVLPLFLILHIYKYSFVRRCKDNLMDSGIPFDFAIIHPASLSSQ